MKLIIIAVLLALASLYAFAAQDTTGGDTSNVDTATRGDYRLELHAIGGLGLTRYSEPPSRYSTRQAFFGYNVNARAMWHPDHLMSVGLMSGYQVFSREHFAENASGEPDRDAVMELSSIPIHLVFEVRPLDIRFGGGIGVYVLLAQLHEDGDITHSWDVAYGGSVWVGYSFKVMDRLRIGPDLVLQLVSDRGIGNLSAMLTVQYDVLVYR
jgi:hypothetical protein